MEAPPNFGPAYTAVIPPDIPGRGPPARCAILIPFLLDGVAGLPELNQGDGIHPTGAGAEKVAATVWSALRPTREPE